MQQQLPMIFNRVPCYAVHKWTKKKAMQQNIVIEQKHQSKGQGMALT